MGTLTSTIQAMTKEVVMDKVFKGFKEHIGLVNYLNWDGGGDIEVNDRGVRYTTYMRPNASGGYFAQAGALPPAHQQTLVAASCRYTNAAMGSAYSGEVLRQMDNPSIIEKGLAPFMKRDKMTLLNNFDQDLWEDGTGVKAVRAAAAVSGTTATFRTTAGSTYGVRRLLIGGRYSFINPSTGAVRAGGGTSVSTVTALNDSGATATFDAIANDTADGDLLVREGSYNAAPRGFNYAISTGSTTIYGINRGTYPEWNSNVKDASGSPLSFGLARAMDHILNVRLSMEDGNNGELTVFTSATQFQAMENVYHPLVRVMNDANDSTVGNIGVDSFTFGKKKVNMMHWCQDDCIWYIRRNTWYKAFLRGPELWEVEGKVLHPEPQVSATGSAGAGTYRDNFLTWTVFSGDMFCVAPRENGVTKGLSMGTGTDLVRPYLIGR